MKLPNHLFVLFLLLLSACSAPETQSSESTQTTLLDSLDVPDRIRQMDNLTVFDPDQPPQYRIRVEHDQTYGNLLFGNGVQRAVVDSLGQVYLSNSFEGKIQVYNPDGTLRDEFGRSGRGPGEFAQIYGFFIHQGYPTVYDNLLSRIQMFSPETFEPVNTYLIDRSNTQRDLSVDDPNLAVIFGIQSLGNREFLIRVVTQIGADVRGKSGFYSMDSLGHITSERLTETLSARSYDMGFVQGAGAGSRRIVSSDRGLVDASPNGKVYKVNTSEILIQIVNVRNGSVQHIYYPFEPLTLNKEEVLQNHYDADERSEMRSVDFGSHWPALEAMVIDDQNRIWLEILTAEDETNEWWVLAPEGDLLGKFEFPVDQSVIAIRNNNLYLEKSDREMGYYSVERYKILMDPFQSGGE